MLMNRLKLSSQVLAASQSGSGSATAEGGADDELGDSSSGGPIVFQPVKKASVLAITLDPKATTTTK